MVYNVVPAKRVLVVLGVLISYSIYLFTSRAWEIYLFFVTNKLNLAEILNLYGQHFTP